ncbi:DNA repair protein [Corallincola platygyrae]|uniref:DNA repair protein n=1 Tax=Corallincola platygyrae TaxID=1193278 RepID=A0ABW4XIH7_9GAMM
MTLYIVFGLIGILLLLVIGVNVIQQHKEKVEAERRAELARQKAIIDETEEMLSYASKLPLTKSVTLMLYKRNIEALNALLEVSTESIEISKRIRAMEITIEQINKEFSEPDEASFNYPDSEKVAVQYVQALKKLRLVLRSEHTKGRVDPSTFAREEKFLDRIQLKVSLENAIKRALAARAMRQFGSARELLDKAERLLHNQTGQDQYIQEKIAEVERLSEEIASSVKQESDKQISKRKEKEHDDLDVLFQPKKKW